MNINTRYLRRDGKFEELFRKFRQRAKDTDAYRANKEETGLVLHALDVCKSKHNESAAPMRKEGIPYWIHPCEVWDSAVVLRGKWKTDWLSNDFATVEIACLLHDVIEDTFDNVEEGYKFVEGEFGKAVADLVRLLTKDAKQGVEYDKISGEDKKRIYWGDIAKNQKACFAKSLDRLNNLQAIPPLLLVGFVEHKDWAETQITSTYRYAIPALSAFPGSIFRYLEGSLQSACTSLEKTLDFGTNLFITTGKYPGQKENN